MTNKITLTKKVAKQGKNLVIFIPSYLAKFIRAGEIVKIEIQKLNLNEK